MKRTKIVATIGPASARYKVLKNLIQNGANVIRINFSHGSQEDRQASVDLIKQVREELNTPVGIMVDTRGPEVRVCKFENGSGILKKNSLFTLYGYQKDGSNEGVAVSEPKCLLNLKQGDIILANDGLIKLTVVENRNYEVVCKVITGGVLGDNKGLNFKDVDLNLPYIGTKDKADLIWAFKNGCDMISASFVNSAEDIKAIRNLMRENKYSCKIIAKIESMSGINNIKDILSVADGVMVARGDLGVVVPSVKLPRIQMDLIDEAMEQGKTVIVATEMLESMIHSPRPTRAETIDVANAVYNGASAVMLSAETATGEYPETAVQAMADICTQAETDIDYKKCFFHTKFETFDVTDVLCHSATNCSFKLDTKAIVLYTDTGKTAARIARFKPSVPIIAITNNSQAYNYLALEHNVMPIFCNEINNSDIFELACSTAKDHKVAKSGENIIVVTGTTDKISNVMRVCQIR